MNQPTPATTKKIQALAQITADLRDGKDYSITRLTLLKSFCVDPEAAAQFALYIAKLTQKKMANRSHPGQAKPTKSGVETVEYVLRPLDSSAFGYLLARHYAERYNPHFGTGLLPESAPMMEKIVEFWGRYYLGSGWRKKLQISSPSSRN